MGFLLFYNNNNIRENYTIYIIYKNIESERENKNYFIIYKNKNSIVKICDREINSYTKMFSN